MEISYFKERTNGVDSSHLAYDIIPATAHTVL